MGRTGLTSMDLVDVDQLFISPPPTGGWWLLGNYDGVHRGHQALIAQNGDCGALRVLTFSPHPRRYFRPEAPPFRLTNDEDRAHLLRRHGVSDVVTCQFTDALAQLRAEDFVEQVLRRLLRVDGVIIGENFHFGCQRRGNGEFLRAALGDRAVRVMPMVREDHSLDSSSDSSSEDRRAYSSSRVREALSEGNLAEATRVLGRVWHVCGVVQHGKQDGRKLGFPTANFSLGDYHRPQYGVYAVRVRHTGLSGSVLGYGVANIGKRPTLDGTKELLEVHLFDFEGDLYGQELAVELLHFLREEQRFENFNTLKAQIGCDKNSAKDWINANKSVIQE